MLSPSASSAPQPHSPVQLHPPAAPPAPGLLLWATGDEDISFSALCPPSSDNRTSPQGSRWFLTSPQRTRRDVFANVL